MSRLCSSFITRRRAISCLRNIPTISRSPHLIPGSLSIFSSARYYTDLTLSPLSAAKKRKLLEKERKMKETMSNMDTKKQVFMKNHTRKWIRSFLLENNLCPFLYSCYEQKKIKFFIDYNSKKSSKNLLKNFLLIQKSYAQLKDEEVVLILYPNLTDFEDYLEVFYQFEDFLYFLQGEEAEGEDSQTPRDSGDEESLIQNTLGGLAYNKQDAKFDAEFDREVQISSFHPRFAYEGEAESAAAYANRSPYPMIQLLKCGQVKRMINSYSASSSAPVSGSSAAPSKCPLSNYFKGTDKEIFLTLENKFERFFSLPEGAEPSEVDGDDNVEMINDNLAELLYPASTSIVSKQDVRKLSKKLTNANLEEKFNDLYERFTDDLEQAQPESEDEMEDSEAPASTSTSSHIDNIWKNNQKKLELLGLPRLAEIQREILAEVQRESRF